MLHGFLYLCEKTYKLCSLTICLCFSGRSRWKSAGSGGGYGGSSRGGGGFGARRDDRRDTGRGDRGREMTRGRESRFGDRAGGSRFSGASPVGGFKGNGTTSSGVPSLFAANGPKINGSAVAGRPSAPISRPPPGGPPARPTVSSAVNVPNSSGTSYNKPAGNSYPQQTSGTGGASIQQAYGYYGQWMQAPQQNSYPPPPPPNQPPPPPPPQ